MRPFWQDPLSTFCDAVESVVGWLFVIVGTTILGLWLGMWIRSGEPPGLDTMACLPLLVLWVSVWFPYLPCVTLLLWYVPHRNESLRLRIGAAVVNWLAWLGGGAGVGTSWWLWAW